MKIHDYEHWCTYMYEENCLERHRHGLEAYPSKEDYVKANGNWLEQKHKEHMKEGTWSESIYLS